MPPLHALATGVRSREAELPLQFDDVGLKITAIKAFENHLSKRLHTGVATAIKAKTKSGYLSIHRG